MDRTLYAEMHAISYPLETKSMLYINPGRDSSNFTLKR